MCFSYLFCNTQPQTARHGWFRSKLFPCGTDLNCSPVKLRAKFVLGEDSQNAPAAASERHLERKWFRSPEIKFRGAHAASALYDKFQRYYITRSSPARCLLYTLSPQYIFGEHLIIYSHCGVVVEVTTCTDQTPSVRGPNLTGVNGVEIAWA